MPVEAPTVLQGIASRFDSYYETKEKGGSVSFHNTINEDCYCVEAPDGIIARGQASTFMRYSDTDIPAAVCKEGEGYRSVCFGFPLETLKEESHIDSIISLTLDYFNR